MKNIFTLFFILFLCLSINLIHCEYFYSESIVPHELPNKVTHLHFYYFDIHTGNNPSAVVVARANQTSDIPKKHSLFGTVYAIDNPLREGPEETSNVVGNAQGLYVASSQSEDVTLTMYVDYAFTSGELNGSSFSVLSRNPVREPTRELAVVGGRGKFRMATGFAQIRAHFLNATTGDGIVEYNVTVFHY
ncbi:putative plant disease resistance response protein [Medicago truncatula]|uniref:Dirigent protein n=1 Tax=Medicago truncatula TaxID=3880 RepID=G7KEI5_MEDTR|nr:dirigent protein 4 [Medicago truncatula]AET00806.1 disease resistance-responsive, dirigent domain protein [Medicago truncatula]RHN58030.1 putative plant disease resistance response protein [Medicago truncatula]